MNSIFYFQSMSVEIHDNSKEISAEIKATLLRGLEKIGLVAEGYAAAVLYKADIEREWHNRAIGVDTEDYILVDSLCAELNRCLGVGCSSFQDLRYMHIKNDACIPIISRYIPRFTNLRFALEIITQQFWRKGSRECTDFLERWASELKANGRLSKAAENTLDNAFVKIQDKSKQDFLMGLI